VVEDYDLILIQDEDWYWGIRWTVGKNRRVAVPKPDIEDYYIQIQFRAGPDEPEDTPPLLFLDNEDAEGVTLASDGTILFHATHGQTAAMPAAPGVYQVDAISPTDSKRHLARGKFLVRPDITRPFTVGS
jgi:hypothetical protein